MPPNSPPINSRRESFIIRIWRVSQVNTWIAEVQVVRTGKRIHLRSLEDLPSQLNQLMEETEQPVSSSSSEEQGSQPV